MWLGELVRRQLSGIVEVTGEEAAAFERHYELMLRWNQRINLTTITELHEAATRHYAESVFLATVLDGGPVVDVGSGPGFPGIPLAIVKPDWRVDLVEAHQRKAVFLREASRDLQNIQVLAVRAEAITAKYDWLVSRAVDLKAIRRLSISPRQAILCSSSDAAALKPTRVVPVPWAEDRVVGIWLL